MNVIAVVLLAVFGLLVVAALGGLVVFWKQILASRGIRVGVAVLTLPVVLFCGFGFLASFEGSDAGFLAFRIGYAAAGLVLLAGAGYLVFGRLRRLETPPVS